MIEFLANVRLYVYVYVGKVGLCVCLGFTHSKSSHRLLYADQFDLPRSIPVGQASGSVPRFPAAAHGELHSQSWSSQRRPLNKNTCGCAYNGIKCIKDTSLQSNKQLWVLEQEHSVHSPRRALKVHTDKVYKIIKGLQHSQYNCHKKI